MQQSDAGNKGASANHFGDRRLGLTLACLLFALYLLSYSGRFHTSDGLATFAMSDSLVRHGWFDIDQIRWIAEQQGGFGPDGRAYAAKGLMTALVAAPLAWLGRHVPWWGETHTALLLNPLVIALTGWLLFAFVRQWGYRRRTALLTALLFGTATLAWPYSKTLLSEPLTGLGLLAALYLLVRFRQQGRIADVFGAGVALACALVARPASGITWPTFAALLLFFTLRRDSPAQRLRGISAATLARTLPAAFAFAAPLALGVLTVLGYNVARFGSPLQTGYTGVQRFSTPLLIGLAGLTISPGRSLFLYAPVLLGVFPAFRHLWHRHRPELLAVLAIGASYLLFYGRWFMWHGGVAWGPRTLVPTVPLLALLLAPLLDGPSRGGHRALGTLVGVSIAVQVLGISVDFDLAQQALLRTGLRLFAPITFFDPRYAQILLQAQFLRPENLDFAWASAGVFSPLALGLSALVLALSTVCLWKTIQLPDSRAVTVAVVSCLLGAALLLALYRQLEPASSRALVRRLEDVREPVQTVILDDPVGNETFLNLYAGPARVLGLNEGEGELSKQGWPALTRALHRGGAFWLVSDGPSRDRNAIDRALRGRAFFVFEETYGDRRLALYEIPREPLATLAVGVRFEQSIQLEQVQTADRQRAGEVLPLVLQWRAQETPLEDYQVFVHLVDHAGAIRAQQDGTPTDGLRPTSSWQPGEAIIDRHAVLLPRDLPPGEYTLRVGLYRLQDGARLETAAGKDYATIGAVEVRSR
jgi:hypothetical protein